MESIASIACCVGIDVAKDRLDVCLLPGGARFAVATTRDGLWALARRLGEVGDEALVVLEATGGLQDEVATLLAELGHRVAVVNPRQIRDFARAPGSQGRPPWSPWSGATGRLAKLVLGPA